MQMHIHHKSRMSDIRSTTSSRFDAQPGDERYRLAQDTEAISIAGLAQELRTGSRSVRPVADFRAKTAPGGCLVTAIGDSRG